MQFALWCLTISALTLSVLIVLFRAEDARDRRLLLTSVRSWCDQQLARVHTFAIAQSVVAIRNTVRSVVRYGLHVLLRYVLQVIRSVEARITRLLQRNKAAGQSSSSGKTDPHLQAIAQHKADSALSAEERERLRSHE